MKTLVLAAVTSVALPVAAHAATVTIDSFGDDQGPVEATAGATVMDSQATASAIGGTRNISVTNFSGSASTEGQTGGGLFGFSNGFATQGSATLSYLAGSADLSDGGTNDTIVAEVLSIDLGMAISLLIDGVTQSLIVNNTGNIQFAFSDFAGVDFTSVDSISLTFDTNGVPAVDASIVLFGAQDLVANPVTPDPSPVPLPAAGWLLAGALAAGFGLRRKG